MMVSCRVANDSDSGCTVTAPTPSSYSAAAPAGCTAAAPSPRARLSAIWAPLAECTDADVAQVIMRKPCAIQDEAGAAGAGWRGAGR